MTYHLEITNWVNFQKVTKMDLKTHSNIQMDLKQHIAILTKMQFLESYRLIVYHDPFMQLIIHMFI